MSRMCWNIATEDAKPYRMCPLKEQSVLVFVEVKMHTVAEEYWPLLTSSGQKLEQKVQWKHQNRLHWWLTIMCSFPFNIISLSWLCIKLCVEDKPHYSTGSHTQVTQVPGTSLGTCQQVISLGVNAHVCTVWCETNRMDKAVVIWLNFGFAS